MPKHLSTPHPTVCIDAETRPIMAHQIDLGPAGTGLALRVLQQAVPTEAWGCPREVLADRSAAFDSMNLLQALADLDARGAADADQRS